MNAMVVVAAREIRERRRLFIVAAALAVVPFVIALVPAKELRPAMVIATAAGFLAVSYAYALAIAQGASTIGRELSDKRFSYFLSKPLPAASIWIGKAAAALATSIGALLIIAVPGFLATGGKWFAVWHVDGGEALALTIVPCIALFLIAHAMSTMIRSRSVVLAIDFVLAILTVVAVYFLQRPLFLGGAMRAAGVVLSIAIGAMVIVLAVVPVWQIERGRADIKRSHKALSTFLWAGVGVVLLALGAYVFWFTHPGVQSLDQYESFHQTPNGEWFVVNGQVDGREDYNVAWVVHAPTGKAERINPWPWWGNAFSRDGSTYAWIEPIPQLFSKKMTFAIRARRLEGAKSIDIDSRISEAHPGAFVLSDDGRRLAILAGQRINVYEVDGGRLLAAAPIDADSVHAMFFPSPDVVRMLTHASTPESPVRIQELNIPRRVLAATGEIAFDKYRGSWLRPSEDGSRLYLRRTAEVLDGRTGATILKLPVESGKQLLGAMLRDGSIVAPNRHGNALVLAHFDRNGALIREIPLPLKDALVAAQVGASHVIVIQQGDLSVRDRKTLLVDLNGAEPPQPPANVLGPGYTSDVDPRLAYYEYGPALTAFSERKLVRWNPKSGAIQPMFD